MTVDQCPRTLLLENGTSTLALLSGRRRADLDLGQRLRFERPDTFSQTAQNITHKPLADEAGHMFEQTGRRAVCLPTRLRAGLRIENDERHVRTRTDAGGFGKRATVLKIIDPLGPSLGRPVQPR